MNTSHESTPLRAASLSLVAIFAVSIAACAAPPLIPRYAASVTTPASITVTSPVFAVGGHIPVDVTCDGKDAMPELVLSSPPEGTRSLVVIVDDPDASNGTFTHMIAFGLSPDLRKIPSSESLAGAGDNARFGLNDMHAPRYNGPCPPKGEVHRYRYRVVALDTLVTLPEGSSRAQIDKAMDGHILGEGMLLGYFGH